MLQLDYETVAAGGSGGELTRSSTGDEIVTTATKPGRTLGPLRDQGFNRLPSSLGRGGSSRTPLGVSRGQGRSLATNTPGQGATPAATTTATATNGSANDDPFDRLADVFLAAFGPDASSTPGEVVVVGDAGYSQSSGGNTLMILLLLGGVAAAYYFLIYRKGGGNASN